LTEKSRFKSKARETRGKKKKKRGKVLGVCDERKAGRRLPAAAHGEKEEGEKPMRPSSEREANRGADHNKREGGGKVCQKHVLGYTKGEAKGVQNGNRGKKKGKLCSIRGGKALKKGGDRYF